MSDLIVSTARTNLFKSNYNSSFQSLFRLPIIFMIVMVILGLGFMIYINSQYINIDNNYVRFYQSDNFASQILNVSMVFFIIATVMFVDRKMHQITVPTLIIIIVIGIIYQSLFFVITLGYQEVYQLLLEEHTMSEVSALISLGFLLLVILKPIILIMLIKIVGQFGMTERKTYHLTLGNNHTILAILFTMMFLIPAAAISLTLMKGVFYVIILSFFDISSMSNNNVYLVGILPSLIILVCILINFLIIFFSVKNCFNREVDTIPLKLLFKATCWSYLYLLLFSIIVGIVYFIIAKLVLKDTQNYYYRNSISPSLIFLNIVFSIIYLVAVIKLTRTAVRKYFS